MEITVSRKAHFNAAHRLHNKNWSDQKKYDSINGERIKLNQKKILFLVNYSLNNNSSPVSAFIIHKYKESINKNYITKVYENFSDELKSSYYGKKLISNL